jgi:hypothetical protein
LSAALQPVGFNAVPLAMPLAVPAGNQTWEIKTTFPTTQFETEAVQWEIKQPCLITSFRPSVVFKAVPLVFVPDILELLEVSLVLDQDWMLTAETNQTGGTPVNGAFVTMGSIGPESRLWNLKCLAATPRLAATFRSKVGTKAPDTSGLPALAIVSVTAIGWYLDKDGNPITGRS